MSAAEIKAERWRKREAEHAAEVRGLRKELARMQRLIDNLCEANRGLVEELAAFRTERR